QRIELGVSLPMAQGTARLASLFIGQRQVVVGVSVGRCQRDSVLVRANAVSQAAGFVQHVTQIEISQRVLGIHLDGFTVITLGQQVVVAIVVKRSQIDVSSCMRGVKFHTFYVGSDGFFLSGWSFFPTNPPCE